jgi:hypothetical protein
MPVENRLRVNGEPVVCSVRFSGSSALLEADLSGRRSVAVFVFESTDVIDLEDIVDADQYVDHWLSSIVTEADL